MNQACRLFLNQVHGRLPSFRSDDLSGLAHRGWRSCWSFPHLEIHRIRRGDGFFFSFFSNFTKTSVLPLPFPLLRLSCFYILLFLSPTIFPFFGIKKNTPSPLFWYVLSLRGCSFFHQKICPCPLPLAQIFFFFPPSFCRKKTVPRQPRTDFRALLSQWGPFWFEFL